MSAPTVFRYVNGDARYRGVEASGRVRVADALSVSASTAYLWGEDVTLDEPALGVSPWRGDLAVRWEAAPEGAYVVVSGRVVADQERVSTTRGEVATPGYETLDVHVGIPLPGRVSARVGIDNVFNRDYANHLNARNPFTGFAVPEPGRVLFARLGVRF
jgi:iron complex outermembrane receptor protein